MSQTDDDARLPLNTKRAVSTFGLSVLGLLAANLLPVMVIARDQSVGLSGTVRSTV
jgi:DHA1 family inner membrane transport protein